MKENLENLSVHYQGFTSRVVQGSQMCWTQNLAKMLIRSYLISSKWESQEKDEVTYPRGKTNNKWSNQYAI